MSTQKEALPQIYIKHIHTLKPGKFIAADEYTLLPVKDEYFLLTETGGVISPLEELAFYTIQELGKYTPNVVYTNNLFKAVYRGYYQERVSTDQYIAELMHWLSQPSLLGNVIKPVVFGTHTVGYSLAAIVKADRENIEIPTQPRPGALGRLLHLNPFAK